MKQHLLTNELADGILDLITRDLEIAAFCLARTTILSYEAADKDYGDYVDEILELIKEQQFVGPRNREQDETLPGGPERLGPREYRTGFFCPLRGRSAHQGSASSGVRAFISTGGLICAWPETDTFHECLLSARNVHGLAASRGARWPRYNRPPAMHLNRALIREILRDVERRALADPITVQIDELPPAVVSEHLDLASRRGGSSNPKRVSWDAPSSGVVAPQA